MTRICILTKKKYLNGNKISHSQRKTKRKFYTNIQKKKIWISNKKKWKRIYISHYGMRIMDKYSLNTLYNKKI